MSVSVPTRRMKLGSALAAMVACASIAAPARSQQPDNGESPAPIGRTQDLLPGRNRSRMHPGDPLVIVGQEQGDNDLRSKTPILAQSDRAVSYVNQDENRKRTLAMYENGATFREPLLARTVGKPYVGQPMAAQFPEAASLSGADDVLWHPGSGGTGAGNTPGNRWSWVFGVGCSVLVGVYLLKRTRFGS